MKMDMIIVRKGAEIGDGQSLQKEMIDDKVGDRISTDLKCKETLTNATSSTIATITLITAEMIAGTFTITEDHRISIIIEIIDTLMTIEEIIDTISLREGKVYLCL